MSSAARVSGAEEVMDAAENLMKIERWQDVVVACENSPAIAVNPAVCLCAVSLQRPF